ncbi:MAG: hypothetical protein A2722_02045 [Candidatus Doudnabacteria bacterium RIFCSPHIGHO2_01_FULL_50_11]|uniref:30S ribosomal protein S20 n=1 Tax=Candidatus Doudnabacteria bacterium RIFCSPHIGHO2_01_FULL_50_11 TaxID=1817828 RepID=A0A1F5PHI1_9BACT|nr:MAG: hypothetical protein A2722_02045 [Candidatus Doudnabacteria bacterium RIFCSPHIGHO2_01_FULL_50_11]HLC44962.1 hypothetical protein [Patescibacteria group bacterium]
MSRIRARTRSGAIRQKRARKGQMRKLAARFRSASDRAAKQLILEKFKRVASHLRAEEYLTR